MFEAKKEQIQEWKQKHGKVYVVKVDGRACYLRRPSRAALGYASVAGKENPLKFNEVMLNECWLAGDEEIRTDDTLFLAVTAKMADIIQVKEAELGEL